jgi:hypothetical protein
MWRKTKRSVKFKERLMKNPSGYGERWLKRLIWSSEETFNYNI